MARGPYGLLRRPALRKLAPAPPNPRRTLPRGAWRKGTASRLLVLLTELTELTDMARPRLTPPALEAPSLASPLPLRLPEAMLLEEELGCEGECGGAAAALLCEPDARAVEPHEERGKDDWDDWRELLAVCMGPRFWEAKRRGMGPESLIMSSSSSSSVVS